MPDHFMRVASKLRTILSELDSMNLHMPAIHVASALNALDLVLAETETVVLDNTGDHTASSGISMH